MTAETERTIPDYHCLKEVLCEPHIYFVIIFNVNLTLTFLVVTLKRKGKKAKVILIIYFVKMDIHKILFHT